MNNSIILSNEKKEIIAKILFLTTAFISIACVVLICFFIFANAIPGFAKIGIFKFLSGTTWKPTNQIFGIFPMILGSIYITAGSLLIGVPIGILTAVYISHFANKTNGRFLEQTTNLLAGIPSVVYGFFGLVVIVPFIRDHFGGTGSSILAASILLGIMILPTIISVSLSALRAVPKYYYEGARALGASHELAVFKVIIPAAKSGIISSIILGMGRAFGETMAVIMVAGNQPRIPQGILKGIRTLTANIVIEMGYAADLHREALIATAAVLFIFILIINLLFSLLKKKVNK